jgi:hypothetical protein
MAPELGRGMGLGYTKTAEIALVAGMEDMVVVGVAAMAAVQTGAGFG